MQEAEQQTSVGVIESELFIPDAFDDIDGILTEIAEVGAASRPLLQEDLRRSVEKEAKRLFRHYPNEGRQIYNDTLPEEYGLIKIQFEAFLEARFGRLEPHPIPIPVRFTGTYIFRYNPNSEKEPHQDSHYNKGIACSINVAGKAQFYVCSNRSGHNRIPIDTSPGNVILIRGYEFNHEGKVYTDMPWHGVDSAKDARYNFLLYGQ